MYINTYLSCMSPMHKNMPPTLLLQLGSLVGTLIRCPKPQTATNSQELKPNQHTLGHFCPIFSNLSTSQEHILFWDADPNYCSPLQELSDDPLNEITKFERGLICETLLSNLRDFEESQFPNWAFMWGIIGMFPLVSHMLSFSFE